MIRFFAAVLTGLCFAAAPAAGEPAKSAWQTYIEAAATAHSRSDFVSAEALLKAALDLAEKQDPDGIRPPLTRLVLQFTYADLNQMEMVQRIGPIRIDIGKVDQGFLPLTKLFHRLGDVFYRRWQKFPANPPTEEVTLEYAARCLRVEIALQKKLFPQSRLSVDQVIAMANALRLYADVVEKQGTKGSLDEAVEQLEQANQLWENFRLENDLLIAVSQQASVLPRSVTQEGLDNFVAVKNRLGLFHRWKAESLQKDNKLAEAAAAFARAESLHLEVLKYFERDWPDHSTTGFHYFRLGQIYAAWNERFAEAEAAFLRALAIYEAVEAPRNADLVFIVKTLAAYLRKAGQPERARELELRFGIES
jgi:tetratricopeptide (TPR) repeat protein